MCEKAEQIGEVCLVQLQPHGLIIDTPGKTPSGHFYDATRLVQVDYLNITPLGIESTISEGEHVLDIHHINHPDKKYGDNDLICIGFTSHYDAMREKFGEHMLNGTAGENIIIDYSEEVWPADLSKKLGIENQDSDEMAILEVKRFAAPCVEFSQFCIGNQYEKLPATKQKEILKFLGNGRRGFLLVLDNKHNVVTVRSGDKVFLLSE